MKGLVSLPGKVFRPRRLRLLSLAVLAVLATFPAAARADTQVRTYELWGAGATFLFAEDDQLVTVMIGVGADRTTTSPPTLTAEESLRGSLYFQRYNPETGEIYNWLCEVPSSSSVNRGAWTVELHFATTCSDGLAEFPVGVDLVIEADGAVRNYGGGLMFHGSERLGEAHGVMTANGVTYSLKSAEEEANIQSYSFRDPLRVDRVVIEGESSGFWRPDVSGLACIGIDSIYAVQEIVATKVFAAAVLDASGTRHLLARGAFTYSIRGGDGQWYSATAPVQIHESADLVIDETGAATTRFAIPVTLTTAGGTSADFVIEGAIGSDADNHVIFGADAAHCA